MKQCAKCEDVKPFDEFHKSKRSKDGHRSWCKVCTNEANRVWYHKNPEYNIQRGKRGFPKNNENSKKYRGKYREENREYMRDYRKRNRKEETEYFRKWREKYPERSKAVRHVEQAIKSGKLQKAPCSVCGKVEGVHGHHEDYSKPLEVIWLCSVHHAEIHRAGRRIEIKKRAEDNHEGNKGIQGNY